MRTLKAEEGKGSMNGTCTWPAHPGNGSAGGRVQR
ncbi:unnamed protein product, partial [Brassica napus]